MPPKKRIFKTDILRAAANLIREQGPEALTVRKIAGTLGVSTQPIYSEFGSIDALKNALFCYAREQYLRITAKNYKEYALAFLRFARAEKNMFRFLYLRERTPGETLMEDINYDETIRLLRKNLELSLDEAQSMHRRMQYYCYSIGVMLATGYLDFSEEAIDRELTEFYSIILRYYKSIKNEQELVYWLGKSRNLII